MCPQSLIMQLKQQVPYTTTGGIRETASCPLRELAIRELAYPQVVQLAPVS